MRKKRIALFILTLVIGTAIGMVYGWVVNPFFQTEASPGILRMDYKTDYVLMTAEVFSKSGDISAAKAELLFLEIDDLVSLVAQAIDYANQIGYSQPDILLMGQLWDALIASGANR